VPSPVTSGALCAERHRRRLRGSGRRNIWGIGRQCEAGNCSSLPAASVVADHAPITAAGPPLWVASVHVWRQLYGLRCDASRACGGRRRGRLGDAVASCCARWEAVEAERPRRAARRFFVLRGADVRAGSCASAVHDVRVTMSSSTSPTGSDWQSTDPSSTSSCGTGSQPSDGEWEIVFLVRDAAVAAAADLSDEQATGALAAADSASRKRGRRRKEEKVAADPSDVGAAASWAAKKSAARERRRRRRRKSAAAPCDAPQRQAPAAAAETTSKTSYDVGDIARPFLTIGWAEACSLLYPSGTGVLTGVAGEALGTGFLPPVPTATPLHMKSSKR